MTLAGSLSIDLYHQEGKPCRVAIASSRPIIAASQLLLGKSPEQLLDTVALLFTLCGNAQAYTALLACRAALGIAADPAADNAHNMLVQLETLREHAWPILLTWPGLIGAVPDKKPLAALLQSIALFKQQLFRHGEAFKLDSRAETDIVPLQRLIDGLADLIDTALFNGGLADFQQLRTEAQLRAWLRQSNALPARLLAEVYDREWAASGQNQVACLPPLEAAAWLEYIRQQDLTAFSRLPHWQGRCFETTLLNRQRAQPLIVELQGRYGNGLIVRLVARLLAVADTPTRLRQLLACQDAGAVSAHSISCDGHALAQIQAARGLLIHRLVLRQNKVYDYRIIAPTEWNFHPDGVAAQSLLQLKPAAPAELKLQAELLLNALDPCVRYTVNLTDSGR
ncbi:Ni,Fe-hydrogenase I large subunit [Methylovulum psychrotolerans]|uniref:Ni,Fe-hydrogenase I large subunit n=1 Tax=Methylovulum psychrotolerans TaxID=1704499 RepID=A0A2S5CKS4_9GAMM|nr:Ni,Fe-hydrogenase I large subunit [Methylovulum psychrotolerans]POZ51342.1 Ni,Fe-hydrogenase I large subunit [Methylovulum psychrotolerans]